MNPVARFENFIERLMERTFTRAARSRLQPVEIGKRLVRAMEREQSVGVEGVIVPNVYDVFLCTTDFEHLKPMRRSLSEKLEAHVARIARQRRFNMMTRPHVNLHCDDTLDQGDVEVKACVQDVEEEQQEFEHTAMLPQVDAKLHRPAAHPTAPAIVYDGQTYAVLRTPTSLGRLADNDIVLDDRRVSRHHAEFVNQGSRWILRDTGSTNGTAVNGRIVKEAVLKPGDEISLGGLEVTWEQ